MVSIPIPIPIPAGPGLETRLARLTAARGPLRRTLARLAGRLGETGAIERLGFARLGDYARERLGLSARKLQELARIDRLLADRPSLEASLRWNILPWCKVRPIARIATPEIVDAWIERARALPTRRLEAAVREEARGRPLGDVVLLELAAEDPERQRWIHLRCAPAVREKWSVVREWAERVAGQRLGDGEALELVVAECISTFSIDPELVRLDVSGVGSRADGRAGSSLPGEDADHADGTPSNASAVPDQGESREASPQEERQVCAPGIEPEPKETERLRWWVPVEGGAALQGRPGHAAAATRVQAGETGDGR